VDLLRESFPERPAFDMAVSAALLERVAAGDRPPALRVHGHAPTVAFGRRDTFAPGYPDALRAARARGFAPLVRLAGGRAAVYHEGTLEIGELLPTADAASGLRERFAATAALLAGALGTLGVDARVGQVAGEYCPGEFSVNARDAVKLGGSAQRVVRGGVYVGTVLVVTGAARIADVVEAVYGALGLDVDPAVTGAIEDERPGLGVALVAEAVEAAFGSREPLVPVELDAETLARAAELEDRFAAPRDAAPPSAG
jgi:octanoyl-[GcvH]:protein N-octanoyltransferase